MDIKKEQAVYDRIDMRRTPGYLGHGMDADGEVDNKPRGNHREDTFRHSETDGFWKRSEFLRCRRGVPMVDIDMRKHFGGPTWKRGDEVLIDHPKISAD